MTSLYYMRARWYDPVTRRFISADPLGLTAGINQYAFAGGDPINGSDPSGMDACDGGDDDGDYTECSPGGGDTGPADTSSSAPNCPVSGNTTAQGTCGNSTTKPDLAWYIQQALDAFFAMYGPFQVSQSVCGSVTADQTCTNFGPNGMTTSSTITCCSIVGGSNVTNFTWGTPSDWSVGASAAGFTSGFYPNGFYFGNGGSLGTLVGVTLPAGVLGPPSCRPLPHFGMVPYGCPQ